MSIPKEKEIIQEIKEIVNTPDWWKDQVLLTAIAFKVNTYEDPGYIEAPIVGESEGPEEKEIA